MCLMAPARITAVVPDACEVELGGRRERASTLLSGVTDLRVGDWVLVNGGTVVRRLDPEQAQAMSEAVSIVFGTVPASATIPPATIPPAMEIES